MRLPRPLLGLTVAAVFVPLALTAAAGTRTVAPTFVQYTSPVGVDLLTGAPEPVAGVIRTAKQNPLGVPVFGIYSQTGIGDSCGEPTLAVHPKTGEVLYQCGLQTLLVNKFGKKGTATWTPVQPPVEGVQSSDPILRQDPTTNRVWINQLMPQGCSAQAYSDDFGRSWTQAPVGCGIGISFDHQTIGAGKATALTTTPLYPNVLYYCTNDLAALNCGVSLDGGLTYGPSHPVAVTPPQDPGVGDSCSPIIGHIKSAPDGTTYVMPDGCSDEGGDQAVFVTTDNALTWTKRSIPHASQGDAGHPSLGVGSDGTVYAAWGSKDNGGGGGRVHVAVSRDRGAHWTMPKALGKELGVHVSRFPLAVAGDGDRAAVAYLGSTDDGNPGSNRNFHGTWRMYVSLTYDRGRTWKTYDATPGSPVQVGSICTGGTSCTTGPLSDRNLLDFNDMVLDGQGRPVIAFADGCLKTKGCTTKDRLRKGAILKMASGKSLYRRFD
ncbi:MAG TPA: sialidase family protein [Mycobacteriales bacterium]|nr:sialidase family protein [Mycobacteriales bacterium]